MEVKIQVSDEHFKDLLNDGINALTEEDKRQLIINGFKDYLQSREATDIIKNKLFTKSSYYGSDYNLTQLSERIIASGITEKDFAEVKEPLIEMLKENGEEILSKALFNIILAGIMKDDIFQTAIRDSATNAVQVAMWDHLRDEHSNNHNNY